MIFTPTERFPKKVEKCRKAPLTIQLSLPRAVRKQNATSFAWGSGRKCARQSLSSDTAARIDVTGFIRAMRATNSRKKAEGCALEGERPNALILLQRG